MAGITFANLKKSAPATQTPKPVFTLADMAKRQAQTEQKIPVPPVQPVKIESQSAPPALPVSVSVPVKLTLSQMLAAKKSKPAVVLDSQSPSIAPILRAEIADSDRESDSLNSVVDSVLHRPLPMTVSSSDRSVIRTSLIDENFPFDESQLEAINGLAEVTCGCLTGSAGTGKTTVTKAIVQKIHRGLDAVDLGTYWVKGVANEDDDDYVMPEEALVPGIVMCAFTGKATQQTKRNFPEDWHANIMTIHRLLGFHPEFYYPEEKDAERNLDGSIKKKVRFIPAYDRNNKLPWKIIIIDEAGMLGTDLWHNLWDACLPDTRIYMIGDINQLQPTHGRSIFGFAMANWPKWELTTIHRQKGVNNSIVDNAWKIINGKRPISDDTANDPSWKFAMMPINSDSNKAARQLVKWLTVVKDGGLYDPWRDVVITPINGIEPTSGQSLGQWPLNEALTLLFTSDEFRYVIDAGRERRMFAVGDRVMATKNDYELNVTNGMMGEVIQIAENGLYSGNKFKFGRIQDVNEYVLGHADEEIEFSLEGFTESVMNPGEKPKQEGTRGPSSHSVTVRFNAGTPVEHDVIFSTLSEVGSLQIAYAVTCHKMQGGEAPLVVIVCHDSHKRMLTREWLYTAITRAQSKCVVLYTEQGLKAALINQSVKGKNLNEKIESFNKLQTKGILGSAVNIRMPKSGRI